MSIVYHQGDVVARRQIKKRSSQERQQTVAKTGGSILHAQQATYLGRGHLVDAPHGVLMHIDHVQDRLQRRIRTLDAGTPQDQYAFVFEHTCDRAEQRGLADACHALHDNERCGELFFMTATIEGDKVIQVRISTNELGCLCVFGFRFATAETPHTKRIIWLF